MAKPRVFVSSTFYDLRQVREDLERFILEMGYESVRNETGAIAYASDKAPESSAYREVELCDIIVTVIGGRFGTESREHEGVSITQKELLTALEKGVQVFIFIEQSVFGEFSTYRINKDNKTIKYRFADDVRIFEHIEMLYGLPKNNAIAPFQTGKEIVEYLRAQWAGLFQRFLSEQKRTSEVKILEEMKAISNTLQQTVQFLTLERKNKNDAIGQILLLNHPAFRDFDKLLKAGYRVSFINLDELNKWLAARSYKPMAKEIMDDDSKYEWENVKERKYLKITEPIFDSTGSLKYYDPGQWKSSWVQLKEFPDQPAAAAEADPPF